MSDRFVSPAQPDTEWQLLAELSTAGKTGSEPYFAESVLNAVRGLKPPTKILRQIREALVAAIHDLKESAEQDRSSLPYCSRVLVSFPPSMRPARDSTVDSPSPEPGRSGWGFFLTTRKGSTTDSNECYRIDLYLYLEGAAHDRSGS